MANKDKEFFIENFAMLVDSHMDIVTALETLIFDIKSPGFRKKLIKVKDAVSEGSPLWKALLEYKLMPEASVSLIKIGENSGRLAENLKLIEFQHRKERQFKKTITSAMMYPMVILGLTMTIGIGISWYILPKLSKVFIDLDIELPLITKVLIEFGALLQTQGYWILPLFFSGVVLFFYLMFFYKKTRFIGQNFLFAIPIFHSIILEAEMSRFGQILGNLLKAGLPILEAVEVFKEASMFTFYKKFYNHLNENLKLGNSIGRTFKEYKKIHKLMPHFVQQIVIAGEKSGNLAPSLQKIGEVYEEKIEITTKSLTVILEPILLITIWLAVIGVALAVILPIYSIIGGII